MIFLSGEELVARLSALVPHPRMHVVHHLGVAAPNAKVRKFVVPAPPEEDAPDPCGHSVAYDVEGRGRTVRRRWIPWAQLLLNVFKVDVMACPRCASRMQRTAFITCPKTIKAILDRVAAKPQPP